MNEIIRKMQKFWWVWYGLLALAVMAPLLSAGYILTLDMVFTPHIVVPPLSQGSYLFYVVLKILSVVVPVQVIQKAMLLAMFWLAGLGMHYLTDVLLPAKRKASLYVAGSFYVINPFTYSRFMAGQFAVLLGYALLPWLLRALVQFKRTPDYRSAAQTALLMVLMGIVSIHSLGSVLIMLVMGMVVLAWRSRCSLRQLKVYLRPVLLAAGIFVVLSSNWLVPLLMGRGKVSETVGLSSQTDFAAFATTGGDIVVKTANMLRLQGFWAEARDLYMLPQDLTPLWGLPMGVLLLVVGYGWWQLRRVRRALAGYLLLVMLAVSALAGGGLAWLARFLPLLGGLREPHKLIGLLALCYAIALAYAVQSWLVTFTKKFAWVPVVGSLLLIGLVTWTLFWGGAGQLRPRQYPAEWYSVNEQLNADRNDFRVLFLPWHQYMSFDFTDDRIVVNPAPKFFDKKVISSDEPEFGSISSASNDQTVHAVSRLLKTPTPRLANELAKYRIKYIIVAHGYEHEQYDYLRRQPGLILIRDTPSLFLYRNHVKE